MRLKKLNFTEYKGQPREWVLKDATFNNINLVVGKNGSGKSRLLNVIAGFAGLLSGRNRKLFNNAIYKAEFESNSNSVYKYELVISDAKIQSESLVENNDVLLKRESNGEGQLRAIDLGNDIKFQVPNNDLVAVTRLDKIQHPFFNDLNKWAKSVKHYKFGEQLGKDRLFTMFGNEEDKNARSDEFSIDAEQVAAIYKKAFEQYKDEFDKAVIKDMNDIGYPCSDVGLSTTPDISIQGIPAAVLFVKEDDLSGNTEQLSMSQGMFRAFSLLIQVNYSIFSGKHTTILIDDIGEGLDFDRSSKLINKIFKYSKENQFDLIMTTNDRYVMNNVDLEYWSVIRRDSNEVELLNKDNSKEIFEKFKFVGLNNFDFFSSEYYLGEMDD